MFSIRLLTLSAVLGVAGMPAMAAQTPPDRTDPSVIEEEFRDTVRPAPAPAPAVTVDRPVSRGDQLDQAVLVGAIRVEGARALPPSAFAAVVEAYAGRTLSPDELRGLASDIANAARERGFGLASAWIPPQRVTAGVLRVVLDEGEIDEIQVDGEGASIARGMLLPLVNGQPVTTAMLERRLLLAGDVAGVRLGKARLDRREGRNILILRSTRERIQGAAYFDNWGSRPVGPVRARATLDFNGVVASDDRATIAGVLTPVSPREFQLLRLAYTKGIGRGGTDATIGAYVAHTRPGGSLRGSGLEGRSAEVLASVNHPFLRSRGASLWGDLEFAVRDAEQDRRGVRIRKDRLATLTASGYSIVKLGEGRARARLGVVQGLDILDATGAGDPLASRRDGSGTFSKIEFWGQYDRPLGERLSLQLQAEGQLASRPLLSSEEMGLGGRYFLRGYDYREFSGDKGVAGSAELRFDLAAAPKPLKAAQIYGYADAGTVGNYRGGGGSGSLASVGGGVRIWFGVVEAGLELGVPLAKGFAGRDQDPRVSFTLGARF